MLHHLRNNEEGDQPLAQNHDGAAVKSARVNLYHRFDRGDCRNGAGGKSPEAAAAPAEDFRLSSDGEALESITLLLTDRQFLHPSPQVL